MVPKLKERLTKVLIDNKLIKEDDLAKALALQKEKGGSLSDIVVEMGLISRSDLMLILSQELGIPPINLSRYKIEPQIIKLVPKKIVRRYNIIPISKIGDTLTIAVSDPLNIFAVDDIKALTGFRINMIITTDKDIKEAVRQHYEEDGYAAIEKIVEDIEEARQIDIVEAQSDSVDSAELLKMTQDAPVVKVTNMLLADAVTVRASDILIEPQEKEMRVRYRVDGILREANKPPKAMHGAIISRLKVMSNLDIAERRLPQDGRFKVKIHGREVDFRVSILPSSKGEKAALRILDKSQAMLNIEKLGLDKESVNGIETAAEKPHGMILVCGPTGCGKTTTLYSILQLVNSPEDNVVTVEDPIEYVLEGVNQITAKPDIGLTFASALRSILRQDPDVVMIGEIRDLETVDIAIKAALTGHLVLSTLHTTTATGSIIRLVNMGVEPFLITSSLIMVGAQRLVRKICPNCREPVTLGGEMLKKLKIGPESQKKQFYRGKGCESCLHTGYKGRTAIIEILSLSSKIRSLILEGAQEYQIREAARKEGMKTLRENGIDAALGGVTTVDEVLRVTVGEQDMETG